MQGNATKARLQAGQTVFGCFTRYPDPALTELLALQQFDFLVLDGEHGTLEPRECENMVRAAELHSTTPLVRVPANQPPTILRFLDTGAQGVHLPFVSSGEEADAAVRAVKYWPRGVRGLAAMRAASYGTEPLADYVSSANEETMVVVQIETPAAVEHVEEIATVDGVDVVFVGPTDLSHAFGLPGQTTHVRLEETYDAIGEAVEGSPASLGVLVSDERAAERWRERGARYVAVTVDSLLARSARALLTNLKGDA